MDVLSSYHAYITYDDGWAWLRGKKEMDVFCPNCKTGQAKIISREKTTEEEKKSANCGYVND